MKKLLTASALAIGFMAGAAQAAPVITFTGGGSGPAAGTSVFQGFDVAAGTTIGTNTKVYSASMPLPSAPSASRPTGATGNYAATGANGSYTISFAASKIFSFVIGSLDSYNEVVLRYTDGSLAGDYLGAQIIGATTQSGAAGFTFGSTTSATNNGLVTFTETGPLSLGSVQFLSGSTDSFEYDTLSASGVPEPAAWGMMILGFGMVGGAMRRRSSVKVRFA
jgi:hypothetical protein